jgi:hypothetical protein
VIQLPFTALTCFLIHKCNLLKARVIIYSYVGSKTGDYFPHPPFLALGITLSAGSFAPNYNLIGRTVNDPTFGTPQTVLLRK